MTQASFTRHRSRRHSTSCANMRSMSYLCLPAPSPDGALDSTAAPVRNPFPFVHKPNTLDRDRIVVPAGWVSWGKIAVLRDGFDAKAVGARHGNVICRPRPESAWMTKAGARKTVRGSRAGQRPPKYACVPDFFSPYSSENTQSTPLPPTPQQSDARTSLSRAELRRERAACRSRPAWDRPHSHRRHLPASSGSWAHRPSRYRLSSMRLWRWRSVARAPRLAASASVGVQARRRRLSLGAHLAVRGAAELLQELSESQGPRGEPWDLGGEPWCGNWEAAADRAEGVGRWCWC